MYITSLDKVKKTVPDMPGIKALAKQVPISRENGAPNFSFRVFTIEPGGHTPLHSHPFEHLNYVIKGSGVLFAENRENPIKKGDFVMVLPGETHQYRNNSAAPCCLSAQCLIRTNHRGAESGRIEDAPDELL